MALLAVLLVLFLSSPLGGARSKPRPPTGGATLKTIRNGVHKIDMYLNAALDLGGEDGLCQYKCSDGEGDLRPAGPLRSGLLGGLGSWRCEMSGEPCRCLSGPGLEKCKHC